MAETNNIAVATLLVLLAIVSVSLPSGALAGADFIARTCESADNARCVAALKTDPRRVNATTVKELASIGIDIAASTAKAGYDAIHDKAGERESSPVGAALADCDGFYADAVRALEGARDAFDAGLYGNAEAKTSAAEDAGDQCEKAFADRELASTLSDVDERMKERSGVASDLIDLLFAVPSRRLLRA